MSFADFIWRNRKGVFTLIVLLSVLGLGLATRLPVAIFPQLTIPRIVVSADAGDLPIATTLVRVTRPIETSVNSVPGVLKVESTTTRGSSDIEVTFGWGADMQLALQRVQQSIAQIQPTLPPGTQLTSAVINPSIFPIMGYSLSSEMLTRGGVSTPRYDLATVRSIALYTIRPRLQRLPGIAQIRVTGGDIPEFVVSARPGSLAAHGITLQQVQDAIANANSVASVGHFDRSYQRYEILVSGLLQSVDDIRNVTVATQGAAPVRVGDIATVTRSIRPPTILATGNGSSAVVVNIIKQPDANTVAVADEVHQALAEMLPTLPPGLATNLFYDQSEIVRQSESSVVEAIALGGILALIVLMAFLSNTRAAAVVLAILPLTILITFCLMHALGQTLNIMTLGGMAIALGLVIDDGIVVVESIFHELETGKSRADAVRAGLHTITPAMVGSSITTMAVFFPLVFLTGVTGQFFAPLAIVMIATLFVSLGLALALVPLLAGYLLPREIKHKTDAKQRQPLFDRFAASYERLLRFSLRRPALVIAGLIPVAIATWLLVTHLQTGFFPEFDEGALVLDYQMPAGTSLAETNRVATHVEQVIASQPDVVAWSRLTGALSGSGLELCGQNQGDILIRLKDSRSRTADEVSDALRTDLASEEPALQTDFAQILQDGIGDMAGAPQPIDIKIYGDDMPTLAGLAHKAGGIINQDKWIADEYDGVVDSGPETIVHVDGEKASRYGLTTDAVTSAATSALTGSVATTIQQGEEGVDVRVQLAHPANMEYGQLPNVPIPAPTLASTTSGPGPTGGSVPLQSVASLEISPGSPQITRENGQQVVSVTARLDGKDLGSGVTEVKRQIGSGLPLPPGYHVEYGGLYASQQESFVELGTVLVLAVLLVGLLLVIQLRSFRQALALFIAAVLALFGCVLALFLTGTPLNISSFTGAIMIVGIVTENGIVLFDYYNQLRRSEPGASAFELMARAGRLRLRPILMTTVGAILALFPLALGLGAGAAMQRPLAIAVIGGLCVSTIFTLLVAPTIYIRSLGRTTQS